MCGTCGCGGDPHGLARGVAGAGGAASEAAGEAGPPPAGAAPRGRLAPPVAVLSVEEAILGRNDRRAAETRAWLAERGVTLVNLVSSPGSGKTTLLERTIERLGGALEILVVEGDQATARDAERIRAAGGRAVQLNTGRGCHLEAGQVARALVDLDPPRGAIVIVENVGNLVCPALFDLGERARVVLASLPEGDDKPVKYPHAFASSDLIVLNKVDLAPYVPFSRDRFDAFAREVAPRAHALALSALRGDGLEGWCAWLAALARSPGSAD